MDLQKLISFFYWCTVINLALLVSGILLHISVPDLIYKMQGKLFHLPRETVNTAVYLFFAAYKIFWLVFNAVPYAALLIVKKEHPCN